MFISYVHTHTHTQYLVSQLIHVFIKKISPKTAVFTVEQRITREGIVAKAISHLAKGIAISPIFKMDILVYALSCNNKESDASIVLILSKENSILANAKNILKL